MNASAKTPNPWPTLPNDRHEAIRRRAEEIYFRNGKIPGHDLENWAQAEQEILRELSPPPARETHAHEPKVRRAAIVINVNGIEYIGEYNPTASDGYRPGEFGPGASVLVSFHGDHMLVFRPNGKTLDTTIVRKADLPGQGTRKTG
jgi:Protein of unknown function (DUF2934)